MKMKDVAKAEREEKVQYYLRLVHLVEVQGQLYPPALGRHAATRGAGAGAGDRAGRAADGRAVCRAGRADPRSAARRIGAHLGAKPAAPSFS